MVGPAEKSTRQGDLGRGRWHETRRRREQRAGASPHNLLADELGDELKTGDRRRQGACLRHHALKDRAAVLSTDLTGNGAYWIDQKTGTWITSTYYRSELPKWAKDFNDSKRAEKYLNQEWKDGNGKVLRTTKPAEGKPGSFYKVIGSTPFANDYEFEFARELITYEKLGNGPATDLLIVSLSANDILGHKVGPDSAEMRAMAMATDRQLAGFFEFLGHQIGLANVWIRAIRRSRRCALAAGGSAVAPAGRRPFNRQNASAGEQRALCPSFRTLPNM